MVSRAWLEAGRVSRRSIRRSTPTAVAGKHGLWKRIDVLQFYKDAWADDERWQRAVDDLKGKADQGRGQQHQPVGTGTRSRCVRGADRRRAGDLQHLDQAHRRRTIPLCRVERCRDRACRSTKARLTARSTAITT